MSYNYGKNNDKKQKGFGFSGFQMSSVHKSRGAAIPPPAPNSGFSKQGYHTMNAISENALAVNWNTPKIRSKTEEEYFDEDEEAASNLEYIPAPGSPSYKASKKKEDSDSEEDPLDAFMAGIDAEIKRSNKVSEGEEKKEDKNKGIRADIDVEDDEESYYRYMEENPNAGLHADDSDQEIEYDEDGNPIAPSRKKEIDPLPPIDHSTIAYEPFEKNFYIVHEEIANLNRQQVDDLKKTLGIKVTGALPPYPVTSFGHFGFDELLIKAIRKHEYTQPTPIQAQAIPVALSGRDLIGIAKTGSGKTAAFVWPMLIHIMDQKELEPGDGPIGLILAPTRELSQQIYQEAKKFGKVYNIRVVCCYGGGSKWEQSKALEGGAEIIVATPGRLIDLVKMKATNLTRVTFLVLDEADRMFDMGFEPQVRSICNHVRPDRQTLLFSATFKKRIEKLARDVLTDPIRIVQGELGEANTDVTQKVLLFSGSNAAMSKWMWLNRSMVECLSSGSVLIFVTKKLNAEELANNLKLKEYEVLLLHGDMDQIERNKVITAFKKQEVSILVATDVAARGLDIPHIRTVINYDVARDIDTHTHRIGRTGRAGEKGTAYTLVTDKDKEFAGHLVRNLEGANQEVPQSLMDLALQSNWFRKSRFKGGKGKQLNVGGAGLGFRAKNSSNNKESSDNDSANANRPKELLEVVKKLERASGPCSDRLSAMKAAFRSQYNTQFRASSDHTWEQTITPPSLIMPPPPPPPTDGSKASSSIMPPPPPPSGSMPPPPPPSTSPASNNQPTENNGDRPDRKRARKSRWE